MVSVGLLVRLGGLSSTVQLLRAIFGSHWRGVSRSRRVATMRSCPRCSSSDLTRDGHDERGRVVYACAGCGRHATTESASLVSGHRFPRDVILLAVRYYLLLAHSEVGDVQRAATPRFHHRSLGHL